MPHQMLKFRIDSLIFDMRRQSHKDGRRYGLLDWTFMQWEWFGGVILFVGSILVCIGSILFLPELGPTANMTGSYVFVGSSVCYMTTSTHDFLEICAAALFSRASQAAAAASGSDEVNTNKVGWMEWYSATSFLCGACLFMFGTASGLLAPMMMDSMDPFLPTAWSFIIGSCCCLTGSMVNTLQIWDAPDRKSAQYANIIAMTYIIGSSFYLCGSIPYLYFYHHHEDMRNIFRCVALFFIIGSVLFLVGAVVNLYRVQYNQKYDPENNWIANQKAIKKAKRISSDIEDPLFPTKKNKSRKGKKAPGSDYDEEDRSETLTRATSVAPSIAPTVLTRGTTAPSLARSVLEVHRGNSDHDDSGTAFSSDQDKRPSMGEYSSNNLNVESGTRRRVSAFAAESSGLWT